MRSAPVYSQDSSSSELLQHDAASMRSQALDLYDEAYGGRLWPSLDPLSGNLSSVTKVTLTLGGCIITSERRSSTFLSRTITVHISFTTSGPQRDSCSFSLPIPTEINTNGVSSMLPSFSCYNCDAMYDVSYFIKVRMVRKKSGFCMYESRRIPIMYLPKSEPYEPPPVRMTPSKVEKMSLSSMTPQWIDSKNGHCPACPPGRFRDISLPSTDFASGNRIPFSLSPDTVKHPLSSQ
ncbi:hypothetical protein ARMGADRAFT_1161234, partial [Armillaria gallica]